MAQMDENILFLTRRDSVVRMISVGLLWMFISIISHSSLVVLSSEERDIFHVDEIYLKPTYSISYSKILRPSSLYSLVTTFHEEDLPRGPVTLRASVLSNSGEVAGGSMEVFMYQAFTLTLQIPASIRNDSYSLRVQCSSKARSLLFTHTSPLLFSPYFLSITVQTSRPIYRSGQEVRFRIIILQTDLLPYNDDLDVFILDPDGIIMRRWISIFTNNGVSSLSFRLPNLAKDGTWVIRTSVHDQRSEQKIQVQTYFTPLFDVFVELPRYISDKETQLTGKVYAMFSTQKYVRGKSVLVWSARQHSSADEQNRTSGLSNNNTEARLYTTTENIKEKHPVVFSDFKEIYRTEKFIAERKNLVSLVFSDLSELMTPGMEIRLDLTVTELMSGETMSGFSSSRVAHSQVVVKFLSRHPLYYHHGKPIQGHVAVCYQDGQPLSVDELVDSQVLVRVLMDGAIQEKQTIVVKKERDNSEKENYLVNLTDSARWDTLVENGLIFYEFFIPFTPSTHSITLEATFTMSPSFHPVTAKRNVYKYSSHSQERTRENSTSSKSGSVYGTWNETRGGSIVVWTNSEEEITVKDYVVFHVRTEFVPDGFTCLVLSKNSILRSEYHHSSPSPLITSISVPVSPDMSPLFSYVVYAVTKDGYLVSDSVTVPVSGFNRYEQTMSLNLGKDFRGMRVEGIASGDEGAFIGFHGLRSVSYLMQAGNELTLSRIMQSYELLDIQSRSIEKLKKISRDGSVADKILYLPTPNQAGNSVATFDILNLGMFTNADWNRDDMCGKDEDYCGNIECYKIEKKCDGIPDCSDGADEMQCDELLEDTEDQYFYSVTRSSRNFFTFDAEEGDWGWREIKKNDHEGIEFEPLWAPSTGDDWYFTAFSVSKTLGLSILRIPEVFSSVRPLMAHMTAVSSCKRGEQVSLRLSLHNNLDEEMLVEVVLRGSPQYKFVHVEENGIVSSYGARLSSGDHQVLIYIGPRGQEQVDIPVAPVVDQGHVKVLVEVMTQAGHVPLKHDLTVLAEGMLINRHTSVFLDLKSRALVLRYLDICVEETPLVPYEVWRRYIYGSARASIILSSDLIGPISDEPLSMSSLLSRQSKSTDEILFEFGSNIWTLHYLRLTNRLTGERKTSVLHFCSTLYAEIMRRYDHIQGGFKYWDHPDSEPSVWLTAWVLRLFKQASFTDWEYLFYVDTQIYDRSVRWLMNFQMESGAFQENGEDKVHRDSIPLTCHVLITLSELYFLISEHGTLRSVLASSNARSGLYLERNLHDLEDSLYSLVLATYSLFLLNSPEKMFAYACLLGKQRLNNEGLIYFADVPVSSNPIKMENQRPFTKARLYQAHDSRAVETTGWALLVILMREGVTDSTEKIVQWLTGMRMHQRAFVSTFDSMVALQALTEYAFRARLLTLTDIHITLETPSSGDMKRFLHLTNSSMGEPEIYEYDVDKVWGHVNVIARGQGHAIAGLHVTYGVDYEPLSDRGSEPVFELKVQEFYSSRRNKSEITLQSCFRYIKDPDSVSGSAVLELDVPTGYHLLESQAMNIVRSRVHPTLRDVHTVPGKTVWYFRYISTEWSCFNHSMRRWHPVANLTLVRQALLYESAARENFVQVLVNSTSLYVLNICEVCGSYQCPYCPYYNTASSPLSSHLGAYLLLLVLCTYF